MHEYTILPFYPLNQVSSQERRTESPYPAFNTCTGSTASLILVLIRDTATLYQTRKREKGREKSLWSSDSLNLNSMQLINAVAIARMAARNLGAESLGGGDIAFGSLWFFIYVGICCFLVLFAGIMSGLTLGLMSLGRVDLEILQRSGTSDEKKQAAAILPVVQKQHQLLVTLLLCNACSMEVIPQAICSRYGLSVGANFVWLVRILMIICYPIAYPIGKILDWVLGHNEALFRRAQLKALVSIHGQEAGKGGELTHDETTIISGALDLTEKHPNVLFFGEQTAEEAMTPIESTFSLDVNSKLDWEAMGKILARGHSRVPVYSGNPKNVIGLLLVKSLLTVRAETETPVSAVSIRRIPRVPADMPLYDILNEFQKGSSHMAAVDEKLESIVVDIEKASRPTIINRQSQHSDAATNGLPRLSEDIEDGEVIGIITLEDVFEELLQEEIVDETDEFVDVHKRIRVAAAAAASSIARAPSIRRLTGHKGAVNTDFAFGPIRREGKTKQVQSPKKSIEEDSNSARLHGNPGESLLGNKR
ncbi:DUF21 domain-containing protein [Vitis vinifera]|uniref:DUF21 domain-containing protein n=1 Tax=Vitis vinifera TaxID=29760 RepID=A0A438KKW6_VITVI|nr:DUF21 domain-containing protein [Vitis vinifera]